MMKKKKNPLEPIPHEEDLENLGLDADHSSDSQSIKTKYNSDNDRISHNPAGEEDTDNESSSPGHSTLSEK